MYLQPTRPAPPPPNLTAPVVDAEFGIWPVVCWGAFLREQSTCSVDYFRTGDSLLIFDGSLNVTLPEQLFTTGVTQGILNSTCILILLIHTKPQKQLDEILDWLQVIIFIKEDSSTD